MLSLSLCFTAAVLLPQQEAKTLTAKVTKTVEVGYLLSVPEEYERDKRKRWPLVLFLHGAGERGSDLEKVKLHGPPKLIESGKRFPAIVVSPQCPDRVWWDADVLSALLDSVEKSHRVDPDRIYVTGLSMGGFGTWALAAQQPQRFAAIAPICGGGEAAWAPKIAHVPAWVVHGDKDAVVPLSASERMVEALRSASAKPTFEIVKDGGHDVWTETYARQDFWDWMLAQKRPKRSGGR